MIKDNEHSELRNLMTPLVNYFFTMEKLQEIPSGNVMQVFEILKREHKIIFESMPRIREILNESTVSEVKECDCNDGSYHIKKVHGNFCTICGVYCEKKRSVSRSGS